MSREVFLLKVPVKDDMGMPVELLVPISHIQMVNPKLGIIAVANTNYELAKPWAEIVRSANQYGMLKEL